MQQSYINEIISFFLNHLNLLQNLVSLKLLSQQFHLVCCIKQLFLQPVNLIIKLNILSLQNSYLFFWATFRQRLSHDSHFFFLDLLFLLLVSTFMQILLNNLFQFVFVFLDHNIFFKDSLNQDLFLFDHFSNFSF